MATLKKILLVDDDDDLREALSEQLLISTCSKPTAAPPRW